MSVTHITTWNAGTLQNTAAVGRPQGQILAAASLRCRRPSRDRIHPAFVIRGARQQLAKSS